MVQPTTKPSVSASSAFVCRNSPQSACTRYVRTTPANPQFPHVRTTPANPTHAIQSRMHFVRSRRSKLHRTTRPQREAVRCPSVCLSVRVCVCVCVCARVSQGHLRWWTQGELCDRTALHTHTPHAMPAVPHTTKHAHTDHLYWVNLHTRLNAYTNVCVTRMHLQQHQ